MTPDLTTKQAMEKKEEDEDIFEDAQEQDISMFSTGLQGKTEY